MTSGRVTIIAPEDLQGDGQINGPGEFFSWNDYDRHYLAEGDSWFSLSDLHSASFLYTFGREVLLRHSTLIVNCASPGDTLRNMVDWSSNLRFPPLLTSKNFGWKWDGVLLSAGGNDIINAALALTGILRDCADPANVSDFIDDAAVAVLEDHLRQYFRYFVELRDSSEIAANRNIPIYYHSYGYPTARNAPASVAGPWLYKAYIHKHIPTQYWEALTHAVMNRLGRMLRDFSSLGTKLHLVDTLANVDLFPAEAGSTGSSGDWLNEIHLNNSGKHKVAKYWAKFL